MTIKTTDDLTQMDYPRYERYKDSGVDWLGDVPQEWAVERLGVLLKEVSEKQHPDLPLLSITRELGVIERNIEDMDSNHNFIPDDLSGYKKVEQGQFGMNKMKAWQGSYGVSPYTGIVSPAYYVFDIHPDLNRDFFSLAIRSKLYISYFGSASDGVRIGQWDLNKTRMRQIRFVIPTLEEQKKIVGFLNEKMIQIDQAITLKQQQIAKLEEYKQIVIQNAVTKGLNPDAPMKDSGVDWIGDIPEHWEIKKIKGVAELNGRIGFRGYSTTDLVNKGEGSITLSPSNLLSGKMTFEKNSYLSWKKYYESPEIMVFNNDILLVKTGSTVGKVGIVKELDEEATINPQLLVFKKVRAHSDYLYYYLSTSTFFNTIKTSATGSTIPTISETKIKNLKIIYPPINEQIEIAKSISNRLVEINSLAKTHQTQINRLKEYKTILINQAVTGKIKVS